EQLRLAPQVVRELANAGVGRADARLEPAQLLGAAARLRDGGARAGRLALAAPRARGGLLERVIDGRDAIAGLHAVAPAHPQVAQPPREFERQLDLLELHDALELGPREQRTCRRGRRRPGRGPRRLRARGRLVATHGPAQRQDHGQRNTRQNGPKAIIYHTTYNKRNGPRPQGRLERAMLGRPVMPFPDLTPERVRLVIEAAYTFRSNPADWADALHAALGPALDLGQGTLVGLV